MESKKERKLLSFFRRLPDDRAEQLLEFAEYLSERYGRDEAVSTEPLPIPRPESETVINAIKRLSATYPMLEKTTLLDDVSVKLTQHMMQGRPAGQIIDELEVIYRDRFERFRQEGQVKTD